jgi:hypothetical protein
MRRTLDMSIHRYGSLWKDCGSLPTQTVPVSDCWHLMLSKHLVLSLILSSLSWILRKLTRASLALRNTSTIPLPFSSPHITSNFSSTLILFRRFSTWTALGDVDRRFSLILVRKANANEQETKWAEWLNYQRNLSIHVTDGVTVTSRFASLLQKMGVATDGPCQIALNRKSSRKFKRWCKFPSRVEVKWCKKKSRKTRPAYTEL